MAQVQEEAEVLQFGGAETDRDKSNDHVAFMLGAEDEDPNVYHAQRPKMAVLLQIAAVLDDDTNPMAQAGAFDGLLDEILDVESVELIRARLRDKDDDLDLDSPGIVNMFQTLVGLWYGRPTGKPRGSRGSSSRTAKASTVRRRSGG